MKWYKLGDKAKKCACHNASKLTLIKSSAPERFIRNGDLDVSKTCLIIDCIPKVPVQPILSLKNLK